MNDDSESTATGTPWRLCFLGVFLYLLLGMLVQQIPNPMVPSAILALNMVVIVVMGHFGGMRVGFLVGGGATLLNFFIRLLFSGFDGYELAAVLPHALMGAFAGWIGLKKSRIATASTIILGHFLNIIAFVATGLLARQVLSQGVFWNGLLAETMVDLILIALILGLEDKLRSRSLGVIWERWNDHKFLIPAIGIVFLAAVLVLLFIQGIVFAPYLFVIPVVLSAIYFGPLGAWVMALAFSFVLGHFAHGITVYAGGDTFSHEIALMLALNLVALATGELTENLVLQQSLAESRLIELKEAYNALSAADHLKCEMIQNISHELRTPLAIILGHTELLASGCLGNLSPDQQSSIVAARKHARRLRYLVEQISVLHQVEKGELSWQMVALDVLAQSQIALYATAAEEKGCCLTFSQAGVLPAFEGDPEYLERVIESLLDNAIKFSVHGGEIAVDLWSDTNKVYMIVRDKGIGIDKSQQTQIFQRFYQVDGSTTRQFGGIGTGLALVREVVQAHGGDVWVKSLPHCGSTFGFWLPVTPPEDRQHYELSIYEDFSSKQESLAIGG